MLLYNTNAGLSILEKLHVPVGSYSSGFKENELRRLLVRAGAVRFLRNESKEEMWCLVKKLPEFYAKEKEKRNKKK